MTEEWLDHVDLPDGQSADLLKRYPYERANMIEQAAERDMAVTQALMAEGGSKRQVARATTTGFVNTVLRASLWRATLKNELTDEIIGPEQIGMASKRDVDVLSERAMMNYVTWYDKVNPGPKRVDPATGIPTGDFERPGGKRDERLAIINLWKAGKTVTTSDRELQDAMFLHTHPGWKPEDLGYPPGDAILVDLMRRM